MKNPSPLKEAFWKHGKSGDCPIIDMHGHMGNWKGIYFPRGEAEQMIRSMDRAGIRTVVFSHHSSWSSPEIMNRDSIAAVRKYPGRFRAYCSINPHYPGITARELERYDELRDVFAGFKLHGDVHGVPYLEDGYRPVFEFAHERGLPVLVHSWAGSPNCGVPVIKGLMTLYPDLVLILGHSMHDDWTAAVEIAGENPSVYLDLCAVLDERSGVLEKFVNQVGSERILFGTDIPWFDFFYYIGAVFAADISEEDIRNILYRNGRKLLERIDADT